MKVGDYRFDIQSKDGKFEVYSFVVAKIWGTFITEIRNFVGSAETLDGANQILVKAERAMENERLRTREAS